MGVPKGELRFVGVGRRGGGGGCPPVDGMYAYGGHGRRYQKDPTLTPSWVERMNEGGGQRPAVVNMGPWL